MPRKIKKMEGNLKKKAKIIRKKLIKKLLDQTLTHKLHT